MSADGRTIVYRLRSVRWSDGKPVTSGDVLFTLRAILDPRNPVRSHEGYDLIDRATAPDARTVVFHLRRAWAPAVTTYFSSGFAPQFVLPAHVLQAQEPLVRAPFNAAPTVGDGPYRFVSWRRGEGLRYSANALYWRGKPSVERLAVRVVPDPSTNLLLLQSGQLDWNLVAPAQLPVLRGISDIEFTKVPTAVVAGLAFNTRRAPLDDVRVRRAVAMSIDRAAISRKITLGMYPVTNMIQPQFSWAFDPSVREPSYDPAAADDAFDAAGWRRDADGVRRKGGRALGTAVRPVSRNDDRRSGRDGRASIVARARRRGKRESRRQRAAFLADHRRLGTRHFRHGVRAMDDGCGSRRFVGSGMRRPLELHAMVRSARSTHSSTYALASTEQAARKRLYARIGRHRRRRRPNPLPI